MTGDQECQRPSELWTEGFNRMQCAGRRMRLVPPGDASALARALTRLGADAELRRWLGAAARERVTSRFTFARMAVRTLELYRSCREHTR